MGSSSYSDEDYSDDHSNEKPSLVNVAHKEQVRKSPKARAVKQTLREIKKQVDQKKSNREYEDDFEVEQAANRLLRAAERRRRPESPRPTYDLRLAPKVDEPVILARQSYTPRRKNRMQGLERRHISARDIKGISKVQRRILNSTLVSTAKKGKREPDKADRMERILAMAEPKKRETRAARFANFDDERNCRFKPRIKKTGNRGNNDNREAKEAADFIGRMEAAERTRIRQFQRTREEKEYEAKLEKKICPNCGNTQSYDEFVQKRKKCPNCSVEYRSKLAWGDVCSQFLRRVKKAEEKRHENLKTLEENHKYPFRMLEQTVYDAEAKCQRRVALQEKKWSEVEQDFLERMNNDAQQRKLNREKLQKTKSGVDECTFKPQLSARSLQYNFEPFEQRTQADLEARQLRRQEYDSLLESDSKIPIQERKIELAIFQDRLF